MLGVESVDALMGKFDGDGSGELDEEELKQLRAYINEKRRENQERIQKLRQSVGNAPPSALRPASAGPRVRGRHPVHCSACRSSLADKRIRCTRVRVSLTNQ